jgi:hypothetical protein
VDASLCIHWILASQGSFVTRKFSPDPETDAVGAQRFLHPGILVMGVQHAIEEVLLAELRL